MNYPNIIEDINSKLSLSGGTMTGTILMNSPHNTSRVYSFGEPTKDGNNNLTNIDVGWNYVNRDGAGLGLRSSDFVDVTNGVEDTSSNGCFVLFARNTSQTYSLTGKADGTLKWGSMIVCSTTYYRSGTSWYRKYKDGFIECGGTNTTTSTSDVTITFPTSFTTTNIQIVTCSNTGYGVIRSKTKTNFVLGRSSANTTYWYACGY